VDAVTDARFRTHRLYGVGLCVSGGFLLAVAPCSSSLSVIYIDCLRVTRDAVISGAESAQSTFQKLDRIGKLRRVRWGTPVRSDNRTRRFPTSPMHVLHVF
jgi:hypothetical protein